MCGNFKLLPPANEVCGKVMFLYLSVSHTVRGGVSAPLHAGIHTLQADTPQGGVCLGVSPRQTPPWADTPPPPGWPLQWTVHILLECILVQFYIYFNTSIPLNTSLSRFSTTTIQ